MSKEPKTLLTREELYAKYVRLNALAQLLFKETAEMLDVLKPEVPPQVGGVPVAASMASSEETYAMLERVLGERQASGMEDRTDRKGGDDSFRMTLYPVEGPAAAAALEQAFTPFFGPEGLFAEYLSNSVIVSGRGVIRGSAFLHQYDEDLNTATTDRLVAWPQGFYRNAQTKEQQLYFRTANRSHLFCVDRLPSNQCRLTVHVATGTNLYDSYEVPIYAPMLDEWNNRMRVFVNVAKVCLKQLRELCLAKTPV